MLSDREQRQLVRIEQRLHEQDPGFTGLFAADIPVRRPVRSHEIVVVSRVLVAAVVLCIGVGVIAVNLAVGVLIAGTGCALLTLAVRSAACGPPAPHRTHDSR